MAVLFIVFAALVALGFVFLSGRGLSLTAGYNTSSKSEKEKLDSKKLSRFMAAFMFVLAGCRLVIPVGFAVGIKQIAWLGMLLFLAAAVAGVVIANTGNRFEKK